MDQLTVASASLKMLVSVEKDTALGVGVEPDNHLKHLLQGDSQLQQLLGQWKRVNKVMNEEPSTLVAEDLASLADLLVDNLQIVALYIAVACEKDEVTAVDDDVPSLNRCCSGEALNFNA